MRKTLIVLGVLASLLACHKPKARDAYPKLPAPEAVDERPQATLSFELFDHFIIIDVEDTGGARHAFLLDTGASFTVLDKSVADAFGAKPFVADDGSTLGQAVRSASGKEVDLGNLQVMPSIKVGDFVLRGEVGAYIADLAPVRYVSGLNVRGILGFQTLGLPFTIDYPRRELRLNVDQLHPGQPGVLKLEESDASYSPNVELEIGGRKGLALIDTGSGECMAISTELARTLPYSVEPIATGFSQTISGTTEDESGRLELDVSLAGHKIEDPIVDLIPPGSHRLGSALLENFEITFDQERNLVRFLRASKTPVRCEPLLSVGFYVGRTPANEWVVALILPGPKDIGIQPGDLLQTINGKDATHMTKPEMKELWRNEKEIQVTLKRAQELIERVVPVRTLVP
jgi:predicted aspartyl protease